MVHTVLINNNIIKYYNLKMHYLDLRLKLTPEIILINDQISFPSTSMQLQLSLPALVHLLVQTSGDQAYFSLTPSPPVRSIYLTAITIASLYFPGSLPHQDAAVDH